MSTPEDSGFSHQANSLPANSRESITAAPDPDNPPWGLAQALLSWAASVMVLIFLPALCVLPYLLIRYRGTPGPPEVMWTDKTYILIAIASLLPAHGITLVLTWVVASRTGKVSFRKSLGLSWPPNFGVWKSTALAILLFIIAMLIVYKFGGQETDLERILRSSRAAALLTAFIAAFSAPLVEEVIYRGLLYSAIQRLTGPAWGVFIVTSMFAGVHFYQYWPNAGALSAITLLSLVLTIVRARTGRLLPCYVIHLVFNGVQSIIIVIDPYLRSYLQSRRGNALTALLHSLFTAFS